MGIESRRFDSYISDTGRTVPSRYVGVSFTRRPLKGYASLPEAFKLAEVHRGELPSIAEAAAIFIEGEFPQEWSIARHLTRAAAFYFSRKGKLYGAIVDTPGIESVVRNDAEGIDRAGVGQRSYIHSSDREDIADAIEEAEDSKRVFEVPKILGSEGNPTLRIPLREFYRHPIARATLGDLATEFGRFVVSYRTDFNKSVNKIDRLPPNEVRSIPVYLPIRGLRGVKADMVCIQPAVIGPHFALDLFGLKLPIMGEVRAVTPVGSAEQIAVAELYRSSRHTSGMK